MSGAPESWSNWLKLEDLTDLEKQLVEAAEFGTAVQAAGSDGSLGQVRAQVLHQLLTGNGDLGPARIRWIDLRGAWVTGSLDLRQGTARASVSFTGCRFDARILLDDANMKALSLQDCELKVGISSDGAAFRGSLTILGGHVTAPALDPDAGAAAEEAPAANLDTATVTGNLTLSTNVVGEVLLLGTAVGGQLILRGAQLTNTGGPALCLDGVRVARDVFADELAAAGEVSLQGASIAGELMLSGSQLSNPGGTALRMDGVRVAGDLLADGLRVAGAFTMSGAATGGSVLLTGSTVTASGGVALAIDRAQVSGSLIADDLEADGAVRLPGVKVGGSISLSGAKLHNPRGVALLMDGSEVGSDFFAIDGFETKGEFRLMAAQVGGQLVLNGAKLSNAGGVALAMDGSRLTLDLVADRGFATEGEVRLLALTVGGQVRLQGAKMSNPGARVLTLDGGRVAGGLYADDGFTVDGTVRLLGANIGGQVQFSGATLSNPAARVLSMDNAKIGADLFLDQGFRAVGDIRMPSVSIGGNMSLREAQLVNPNQTALLAPGLKIEGSVLAEGMRADGEVRLTGTVGDCVDFEGAEFRNGAGTTLDMEGTRIRGSLQAGLRSEGAMNLSGLQVGDTLCLTGTYLAYPDGDAASLRDSSARTLLLDLGSGSTGPLDLRNVHAEILQHPNPSTSPEARLSGFRYVRVDSPSAEGAGVVPRLEWLGRDPDGFSPGIFDTLAQAYQRSGEGAAADAVRVAGEDARHAKLGTASRAWGKAKKWTVGYGYEPLRAILWLPGYWAFASAVLWCADRWLATLFDTAKPGGGYWPALYMLDLLLPFMDFPSTAEVTPSPGGQLLVSVLLIGGFLLVTAAAAGLAGRLAKGPQTPTF